MRFSGSHSTGLLIVLQINSQAPYTEKLTACDRSSCEEMLSPGNGAEQPTEKEEEEWQGSCFSAAVNGNNWKSPLRLLRGGGVWMLRPLSAQRLLLV